MCAHAAAQLHHDVAQRVQHASDGQRCVGLPRRSFARVVMVAGTPSQVAAALAAAEPFRQQLQERGVFVVGLPIFPGGEGEEAPAGLAEDDLR